MDLVRLNETEKICVFFLLGVTFSKKNNLKINGCPFAELKQKERKYIKEEQNQCLENRLQFVSLDFGNDRKQNGIKKENQILQ